MGFFVKASARDRLNMVYWLVKARFDKEAHYHFEDGVDNVGPYWVRYRLERQFVGCGGLPGRVYHCVLDTGGSWRRFQQVAEEAGNEVIGADVEMIEHLQARHLLAPLFRRLDDLEAENAALREALNAIQGD